MKTIQAIVSVALVPLLAACGTSHLSRGITPEGWVNGEIVFPDVADATLKEGTFPNPAGLKQLGNGVTKDQVYELVGRPHFHEGAFMVREWDYVFNFRGTAGSFVTCQYKIVFSKDGHAQSFFPRPEACAVALEDYEVTPAEADAIRTGKVTISGDDAKLGDPAARRELSADALFEFGSATVTPAGLAMLLQLAKAIQADGLNSIAVEGHTDRLGDDRYNAALSLKRAEAVSAVLAAAGVSGTLTTRGIGSSVPKVQCASAQRPALVACLAPNRRVVVIARREEA